MHNDILKRLDIIKNAVAMEEEDLIAMQIAKLETQPLDAQVLHILNLIKTQQFQHIIQLIEQYKHDSTGLVVFEDPQIQGLKLELKLLENSLNDKTDELADLERQINEFNSAYMQRLGSLIEAILKKRAELNKEDSQAQHDWAEFSQNYQQQLKDAPLILSSEQQQQLKTAYRQASRLCHPDKLTDAFKAQGTELFKALNEAYRHQDLVRVLTILQHLESGNPLSSGSDSINDKELLTAKIAALRLRLKELETEINSLLASEYYQRIQIIADTESYFASLEKELLAELNALTAA
jgi:tetrahydromethanopterin S-methyltransferase subunit G